MLLHAALKCCAQQESCGTKKFRVQESPDGCSYDICGGISLVSPSAYPNADFSGRKTDVTNENTREIILDILLSIFKDGVYSHTAIHGALEKYQYLSKRDRAFIIKKYVKEQSNGFSNWII